MLLILEIVGVQEIDKVQKTQLHRAQATNLHRPQATNLGLQKTQATSY